MTELQRVLEDVQILMENEKRLNHNHAKTGAIRQLLDDIQLDLGVYQRFLVDGTFVISFMDTKIDPILSQPIR